MGSVILALLVLAVGAGLSWMQDKPEPVYARQNGSDDAASIWGTHGTTSHGPSHHSLGVTMQYDAPCPRCDGTPVEILAMVDGQAWICPHCGHQEIQGAADVDAYVKKLGGHDPETVAAWREALGLASKAS